MSWHFSIHNRNLQNALNRKNPFILKWSIILVYFQGMEIIGTSITVSSSLNLTSLYFPRVEFKTLYPKNRRLLFRWLNFRCSDHYRYFISNSFLLVKVRLWTIYSKFCDFTWIKVPKQNAHIHHTGREIGAQIWKKVGQWHTFWQKTLKLPLKIEWQ